jgi:hypothetical protein
MRRVRRRWCGWGGSEGLVTATRCAVDAGLEETISVLFLFDTICWFSMFLSLAAVMNLGECLRGYFRAFIISLTRSLGSF